MQSDQEDGMQPATIEDAEFTDHEQQPGVVVPYVAPSTDATLFHTDDPVEVIAKASKTATALAEVVKRQQLATKIQGRDHVRVEGWTLLGSMLGVFPVVVWTRKLENGWEARVEARTRDGQVVGAAEAECLRSEKTWASRDDYTLRSMAQTRATSKALRGPLGFVMTLAGFDATPAEEMPREAAQSARTATRPAAATAEQATDTEAEKAAQPRMASKPQIQKIAILRNKVIEPTFSETQWRDWLEANFGVKSTTELTSKAASSLIERLVEAEKKMEAGT